MAVFSDAFSDLKRRTMEAFGAEVITVSSYGRGITPELIQEMNDKYPKSLYDNAELDENETIIIHDS